MTNLLQRTCVALAKGSPALTPDQAKLLGEQVDGWSINADANAIERDFRFKNYYETIAFVNAMAWIVHREDHHPDLEIGYNHCLVQFSTHSVGGLSDNDFICAAKINAIQD
ncbi:MAG TPA: 4a-hydroxytetrahydrobiopterin dehydratase [Chromatiales bacterium]|jgi:4a-hydroxytetrahydrobiopterin dehydratase|nr:4a-hydroxytetrahydrobiopterin dehydratase [Chromatiaceae bacterium]HIB85435.1 4a-hydroxytetrahydrobiopterin dehydratase [Chromatiaceae bacterium]HIO13727.1 4a-hydroxytetrahydrobiopterin dehydratase [Chromatiales bacterium]HIO54825.1 4a-hydroxytetrahydrobiopterin dehydratase [Chromatiales bacterium]